MYPAQENHSPSFLPRRVMSACSALGVVITLVAGSFYIARSHALFLADGYIFLAYARQLATALNWGINPGEISFAASSPLWTVICALFYSITPSSVDYARVMQVVGLLLMAGALSIMDSILRRLSVPAISRTLAIGIYAAIPFDVLFYAISGMETGLYIFLFFCVVRVANSDPSPRMAALSGILTGLLFLTRIEGAMCMFAFAALIAIADLSPRNKLHLLAIAGSLFICVIAPWQLFLFLKAGIVVPTSGSGRLFLYFPIQGLELSQYISLSLLQRLSYVGEIFQSNFIAHPLQLLMGIIPIVGTVALFGIAHFSRTMPAAKVRRDVVMFLAIYCSLNLCIYFLFQPLIFQRYLIAAVPSFIICLLAVAPWKGAAGRFHLRAWARIGISAAVVSALAFINWIGVRYFDTPTTRDTQIIALFKQLDASVGNAPCRLAAEPLGVAAYFTRCYVVDLGGLINPDLWPYWIRAGRKGLGQATMQYAIDRHANFVYSSDGSLPSGFADQFELRYQIAPPWAIFEFKGPTRQ